MVNVSQEEYQTIAAELIDRIDGKNYTNMRIAVDTVDWYGCLTLKAIMYWQTVSYPEGDFNELRDIVPVWWEFHTEGEDGEVLNDFQFAELKKHLI